MDPAYLILVRLTDAQKHQVKTYSSKTGIAIEHMGGDDFERALGTDAAVKLKFIQKKAISDEQHEQTMRDGFCKGKEDGFTQAAEHRPARTSEQLELDRAKQDHVEKLEKADREPGSLRGNQLDSNRTHD